MDNITKSLIFVLTIGGLIAFMAPSSGGVAPPANPAQGTPVTSNTPPSPEAAEPQVEESVFGDIEEFDHSQFGEPLYGYGDDPDEEKSGEGEGKKRKGEQSSDDSSAVDFSRATGGWSSSPSSANAAPRAPSAQPAKAPRMPKSGPAPRWQGKQPPKPF